MSKNKLGWIIAIVMIVVGIAGVTYVGNTTEDQSAQSVKKTDLGKYKVTIDSDRIVTDVYGKRIAIITYTFTNVSNDDAVSFSETMDDQVYQNGVGLNSTLFVYADANYDYSNQRKKIKKGASIQLEVAYELNDTTSDLEVEVSELFSTNDTVVKKTFSIK